MNSELLTCPKCGSRRFSLLLPRGHMELWSVPALIMATCEECGHDFAATHENRRVCGECLEDGATAQEALFFVATDSGEYLCPRHRSVSGAP